MANIGHTEQGGGVVFAGKLSELLHFAYGADMNERQMRSRGVGPVAVGLARLPGHRLAFHGHSRMWDGGTETVVPLSGHEVWGVLYRLGFWDGEVLDLWQDVRQDGGGAYFHSPATVIDAAGEEQLVLLYKKDILGLPTQPSREYRDFIVQGAEERGLPGWYVDELRHLESKQAGFAVPRLPKFGQARFTGGCAECGLGKESSLTT